jgi:hypothetical protein
VACPDEMRWCSAIWKTDDGSSTQELAQKLTLNTDDVRSSRAATEVLASLTQASALLERACFRLI